MALKSIHKRSSIRSVCSVTWGDIFNIVYYERLEAVVL
ncbi:hypothetical protein APHCRT_1582 [Anaplasma phagocytophilum str. CRT53-1]|uniref:Uncharacterized protein n=1 Tax=Anaplasma phagocytophilum str. CRT53-1 TaxID=1359157 RepID=A0A0F3PJT9_ANAPH|nr:hypothetical protein APHCRT_1600 [Anaplasma phagocytophilum str. CRT53-1]KJV80227.1 hypothetical protein APHCRT_1582 [Anaplasma phagocytophilum str. CRT53-1]